MANNENNNPENMCDIIKLHELIQLTAERNKELDSDMDDSPIQEFKKCEVYYCIGLKFLDEDELDYYDLSKIRGKLTISKNLLYFEPDADIPEKMQEILDQEELNLSMF